MSYKNRLCIKRGNFDFGELSFPKKHHAPCGGIAPKGRADKKPVRLLVRPSLWLILKSCEKNGGAAQQLLF